MEFEWDDTKERQNYEKHGVRFTEAVTVWLDSSSLEIEDKAHNSFEDRWIRLGFSRTANLLVVVYVEQIESERVRIISARKATQNERTQYHWR